MESFKQGLAFLLFGTVAYLVWVLAGQVEETRLRDLLLGLVVVSAAAWVYGRWRRKRLALGIAGALLVMGLWLGYRPHETFWQPWSPEKVAALREEGKPIYIDFTARWCATCQLNKERIFGSGEVMKTFREKGIVALRADWTRRDPQITRALENYGKSAVPVNMLYIPRHNDPIILPELLDSSTVLDTIKNYLK